MDKQKLIEGIARSMCENFRKGVRGDNLCGQLAFKCECKCKNLARAEKLYNAGYRKITEGSMVLTKGELEEILVNYVPQECIDDICKKITGVK